MSPRSVSFPKQNERNSELERIVSTRRGAIERPDEATEAAVQKRL